MTFAATFHLHPSFFAESERLLLESGELRATAFVYPGGVQALRLSNAVGSIIVLPYQGQQVWDVQFYGRTLTMRSMFDRPYPTTEYLRTYGAFLVHCGVTAMGVPGPGDTHPLHGELPNATFRSAALALGEDARGPYLAVTGEYRHTVAFACNYVAQPTVRLYAGSGRLAVSLTVHNLKQTPMELMYLAHANFRPVDYGRLLYTAPCTPRHVRVRRSIPSHIRPAPGYREFLEALAAQPERHNVLAPDLAFDPEVVFFVDYLADAAGWAHTMQVHPDGSADFISHRPDQLRHGVRWISRTPDQDALGMVLPATAEPEGYTAEKAKGHILSLPGGATWRCDLEMGALTPTEAAAMAAHIEGVLAGAGG
jgi:hypothetical protein